MQLNFFQNIEIHDFIISIYSNNNSNIFSFKNNQNALLMNFTINNYILMGNQVFYNENSNIVITDSYFTSLILDSIITLRSSDSLFYNCSFTTISSTSNLFNYFNSDSSLIIFSYFSQIFCNLDMFFANNHNNITIFETKINQNIVRNIFF